MADSDVPSRLDKLRYQIDRFLSWSPLARFLGLFGLSFVLTFVCAVLARLVMPQPEDPEQRFDFLESLWWSMTRMFDAGTFSGDQGFAVRFVGFLATLCGVAVVALLIGLVSSTVGEKLEDLRKGKSPVIDAGHTLILGFGEKVFALLKELKEANANQKEAVVVILSEADKEEVETQVRERMGDLGPTRVVVRQGSPHAVLDLRKVGAGRAKSLIVLADEESPDDLGAIKTLLALRRIPGALTKNHAVVELLDGSRRGVVEQLGAGGVEVVAMAETLSRMMVQTSRQNGLAQVYRDLLTYEGSEFYFAKVGALAGKTFGDAQWATKDAVVCGVRRAGPNGTRATQLNPPRDVVLAAEDELLVIAEDDDTFAFTAQHQPSWPDGFTGAPPKQRLAERLIICGRSPKLADMLREFDQYVLPGSEAWLMPGGDAESFSAYLKDELGALKALKLKLVHGDPTDPAALEQVASSDFAVALVVADTSAEPDEADARTVMTVLLLRDLFKRLGDKKPRIISEILDPRTKDLLEQDYGADFVVSAEMTSMLLAQVSERRELNAVFADLFDSDGNEVYLKRAACYALLAHTTSWLSVQRVALDRGEIAIGYQKLGQRPQLNPKQTESLILAEEDRIIVIAEDDSEAPLDTRGGPLASAPPAPVTAPHPPPGVQRPSRSGLLPPEPKLPPAEPVRTATAGPRVAGPSTAPRPPLPPKPKG